MNAERLHAIVKALKSEFDAPNLLSQMQNVVNALRTVVQQNNSNSQNNLANHLSQLRASLGQSQSDNFSPAWREVLRELGGEDLFGKPLLDKVEASLARNQITVSVAADELEQVRMRMEQFYNAVNQTASAFGTFHIGDEKLAPGECEIGMLIPREAVDNSLVGFAGELKELAFILNTFSEVATGEKDDLAIRTISSSELLVYLQAHPHFAACVAVAIERTVALYKQLLEIRKLHQEIQKQGVPESATKGIEEHANKLMENGIEELSIEIVNKFHQGKDGARKNELTNAVRISLNKIANRIDRGYNIEVRCEPLASTAEDQDSELKSDIEIVQSTSVNMQFLKLEGPPILKLPEKTDERPRKKQDTAQ